VAPETLEALPPELWPNVENLVTEDDTPVDNIFSEKQQRLLTESLYSSWAGPGEGRPFLALANVGLFYALHRPPLVPDMMLSLDVQAPREDIWAKRNRSYFVWEYGKPPEVVIEVVSNLEGEEAGRKLREYARIGVTYYVIFDPLEILHTGLLRVYALRERVYTEMGEGWLPAVGLGLTLWAGTYEGMEDTWLRWCDQQGRLILRGAERAEQERQRAEQERQRAEQERQRAEQAEREVGRLMARLRELGVDPLTVNP
jgi:Uma2 family endonuclease